MAKSKQTASSAKPARSARIGAPAGKKGVQLKPARRGRRASQAAPAPTQGGTKQARVIALLERDSGATLDELVAATGWLPHTTRAALTGLRQKGFVLDKSKREDGTTVYRITSALEAGKAG
jgi:DNA-binding MarR family transcriptional regulator